MTDVPRYVPGTAARIGGWPKSVIACEPDETTRVADDLKAQHLMAWQDFGTVLMLLEDHAPHLYRLVKECRTRVNIGRTRREARVVLEECGLVPYCLACTDAQDMRRAGRIVSRLRACTPAGRPMELRTWAFSARLSRALDTWGMNARERIVDFRATVRDALRDIHGYGYGASLAYHDVGESGFAKPNPHIDVVTNGWMLDNGTPRRIPRVELREGGKRMLGETWMRHVRKAWPLADPDVWDIHTSWVNDAESDVWKVAKYHAREVINFRHVAYDRNRDTVTWLSDKEQFTDATLSGTSFMRELRSYVHRTGGWKSPALRCFVGHLSDGTIKSVAQQFGNTYGEHNDECRCPKCVDYYWRPGDDVHLPDEEREAFGA